MIIFLNKRTSSITCTRILRNSMHMKTKNLADVIDKGSRQPNLLIDVSSSGVMKIVINRPKKKNAFSLKMYDELGEILHEGGLNPEIKVALLTGSGDFYSSGNDLSNFSQIGHPLKLAKKLQFFITFFQN